MSDYEKMIVDGKVAVLYSPGFGAGWYSWNRELTGILFDRDIVQAVLDDNRELAAKIASERYDEFYTGGSRDLEVAWLPVGTVFRIHEYDGNESIEVRDKMNWIVA